MIEPYYIYVDVFCTHLFLHTVKSKAAGDLALNFFFTVSVKSLPSQVCFNILSELANGRSKIENRTYVKTPALGKRFTVDEKFQF